MEDFSLLLSLPCTSEIIHESCFSGDDITSFLLKGRDWLQALVYVWDDGVGSIEKIALLTTLTPSQNI